MAVAANKRSTMTLYADPHDLSSHRVRIVLAEKGVAVDIIDVDKDHLPDDFKRLNPYQTLPTLIDRDLALYEPSIIVEYLDERFPHPPLLPVYPVARAKNRLMMYRIEIDWYRLVRQIEHGDDATVKSARKALQESLLSVLPIFSATPYFLSEEFSLVDCGMAPLLWRLSKLGITLPPQAKAIKQYAERLFDRSSFKSSLTQVEREFDDIK
jgi:RNA polymerase-associated protein